MSIKKYLETSDFLPLEKNRQKSCDLDSCIPFSGSLRRHPYDSEKVVLIYHAFREDPSFFEFKIEDIKYIEDMPNIVSEKGENLKTYRIWIQKGSLAVRYDAFEVNDKNCATYSDENLARKSS